MSGDELIKLFREFQDEDELMENKITYEYIPVISDNLISLAVSNRGSALEINNKRFECFDIILSGTKEQIGCISFDYYSKNLECGNVSYVINEQYQNKGYATRALKLLVQLLKNNNFKGDKDLYFWIGYYNDYSKKVVLNNGGEIISGGDSENKTPYILKIKI